MANPCPLILCKSIHHGNTARVARAIAAELDAEIALPEEVSCTSLQRRPLVGFGSGVYYGRMHEALFDWLSGLPEDPESRIPAFVFSTSGLPWLAWLWHRPMRCLLARKGFRVIGDFSCGGYDTWGPLRFIGGVNRKRPDERDLTRAGQFARRLIQKLAAGRAEPARRCS
jgi:flavodoxin